MLHLAILLRCILWMDGIHLSKYTFIHIFLEHFKKTTRFCIRQFYTEKINSKNKEFYAIEY